MVPLITPLAPEPELRSSVHGPRGGALLLAEGLIAKPLEFAALEAGARVSHDLDSR